MTELRNAATAAAALAVVGCSVINSYDDVVPRASEGGAGTGGSAGSTAGSAGVGGGGMAGVAGSAGTAGSSAGMGGSAGTTGGSGGVDSGPTPQEGTIVVGGDGDFMGNTDEKVLAVIDPKSGNELSREKMNVIGAAYDRKTDHWFIFERVGGALDPAVLHVRQLDTNTGAWTEVATVGNADAGLGAVPVPLSLDPQFIAVLSGRILYASTIAGSPPQTGLTLLGTNDLSDIKVVGLQQSMLPAGGAIGMMAHPASNTGGRVTIIQPPSSCAPGMGPDGGLPDGAPPPAEVCDITLVSATVGADASPPTLGTPKPVGQVLKTGGSAAGVPDLLNDADYMVFPPLAPSVDPTGTVQRFSAITADPQLTPARPFAVAGPRITSAAYDPCTEVVFATEFITDQAIFAIPTRLDGGSPGTTAKQALTTAGQRVLWEPYTRTVIRPFDDDSNREISAFELGGTDIAPSLTRRTGDWSPPSDLRPRVVLTKIPENPVACP